MEAETASSPQQPPAEALASCAIGFEWMPFSGAVKLSGAEGVLPSGASFWGALAPADRDAVRRTLSRGLVAGGAVELECRLETLQGVRTFLMRGEPVPGEPGMSSRIAGVLLESDILRGADAETKHRSLLLALATCAGVKPAPPAPANADVLLAEAVGEELDGELVKLLSDLSFVAGVLRHDQSEAEVTDVLVQALIDARRVAESLQASGRNLLGFVQLHAVESVQPIELHRSLSELVARRPQLAKGRAVAVRKVSREPVTAVVSPAHLDYAVTLAVALAADVVPPGTSPSDPVVIVPHPAGPASVEIEIHPPGVTSRQQAGPPERTLPPAARVDLTLCRSLLERMGGAVELESEPGSPPSLRVSLPATFLAAGAAERPSSAQAVTPS